MALGGKIPKDSPGEYIWYYVRLVVETLNLNEISLEFRSFAKNIKSSSYRSYSSIISYRGKQTMVVFL